MPLKRKWFEPCPECGTPEQCEKEEECAEGFECMHTAGFDFTQEEEDRLNDPRHG